MLSFDSIFIGKNLLSNVKSDSMTSKEHNSVLNEIIFEPLKDHFNPNFKNNENWIISHYFC